MEYCQRIESSMSRNKADDLVAIWSWCPLSAKLWWGMERGGREIRSEESRGDRREMTDMEGLSTTQVEYSVLQGRQCTWLPGAHPVVGKTRDAKATLVEY